MKILCLSNGHGEDVIAVRIIRELQQQPNPPEIAALPLLAQIAAIWVAAIQIYNRPLTAVQLADTARWQQRLDVISNLPGLLAG